MRHTILILFFGALSVSCGGDAAGPKRFPEPIQVSVDDIPQPFGNSFYFKYGWNEQAGPEAILEELLNHGVQLQAAWCPDPDHPGPCLIAQLTQLIVELRGPDQRMLDLGFTQDASQILLGVCNPFWLMYDFRN
jgi:hypothetical protein